MTDASAQLLEKATFCKPNDDKRPGVVGLPDFTTTQVCPDKLGEQVPEVTTAYPDGWYVRVMFDELLDPSIEDLTEILDADGRGTDTYTGSIAGTHPFKLECESSAGGMITIGYDGYYSPAGNRVTWPVGPSLVAKPNTPTLIGTNTPCQITLNDNIVDKDGNPVPTDQRGPYKFKVAPIQVIFIDPPDDPDSLTPIPAEQIYSDNFYLQFNTAIDLPTNAIAMPMYSLLFGEALTNGIPTLCPDADGDAFCDDDAVFQLRDVAHPADGPGFCNDATGNPCGTLADCAATGGTVCGRGYCGADGSPCNVAADCPTAMDHCGALYAYDYIQFGLTAAEFGVGPPNPIETERKYTFSFTQGAMLKDRCGRATTIGAPNAKENTLVHFATEAFKFNKTSIVNGETSAATKHLQFNWNNVLGSSPDPTQFTLSPAPSKMTAGCTLAGGCPVADIAPAALLISAADGSGQLLVDGHYKLNTSYTATLKAGAKVTDAYGKESTNPSDMVIGWKTAPAIVVTSLAVRNTGGLASVGDLGTLVKPPEAWCMGVLGIECKVDIRIAFNADMDPTSLTVDDVTVEPAVANLAVASSSGCASFSANPTGKLATCTLRLRGTFAPGTYKITLKKDAAFKDMFGVDYVQAADKTITVKVKATPPAEACL